MVLWDKQGNQLADDLFVKYGRVMGTQQIKLRDIDYIGHVSRLRLLAPLRYLTIRHPEKHKYDVLIPTIAGLVAWGAYTLIHPKPPLFGEAGLLRFARDLLIMAVPFMVGALAAVSMGAGAPFGSSTDRHRT
jgi:hypothetical protein